MKKSKSFTLIELIVAIGVIFILTAATLPFLNKFKVRADLKTTALEIESEALLAKNYSLAPRVSGNQIQSYSIIFYGPRYQDMNKQNSYEVLEYGTGEQISGSFRKLPKDVSFKKFDWPSPSSFKQAEIRFSVENQGEIISDFTSDFATIVIEKNGQKPWNIEVIKATGAVRVYEGS